MESIRLGRLRVGTIWAIWVAVAVSAAMPLAWCHGAGDHVAVESVFLGCAGGSEGAGCNEGTPAHEGLSDPDRPAAAGAVLFPGSHRGGCQDYSIRGMLPRNSQGRQVTLAPSFAIPPGHLGDFACPCLPDLVGWRFSPDPPLRIPQDLRTTFLI